MERFLRILMGAFLSIRYFVGVMIKQGAQRRPPPPRPPPPRLAAPRLLKLRAPPPLFTPLNAVDGWELGRLNDDDVDGRAPPPPLDAEGAGRLTEGEGVEGRVAPGLGLGRAPTEGCAEGLVPPTPADGCCEGRAA